MDQANTTETLPLLRSTNINLQEILILAAIFAYVSFSQIPPGFLHC